MPPPSQKGTGKKGNGARQSRSRNTTPSLAGRNSVPPTESGDTALLELPLSNFRTADDLFEIYHHHAIPSARDLDALVERIKNLQKIVDVRGDICDKGMRLLAKARKERFEDIENERRDEERKERVKKEAIEEEERKANKKKRKEQQAATKEEQRPLTHGAHGLAPQDDSKLGSSPSQRSRRRDSASSSLSPMASPGVAVPQEGESKDAKVPAQADDDDSSDDDERQPAPAPAIPHLQTFGDDPSTFPDPTIYEVLEITDDMDIETKKSIYSVEVFPESDLSDLIPGYPPDKDFSTAKPTNQVQANTFATYIEPFFRPYTEEDLAFLRERGDRTNAFVIPKRGKRHYKEIWAEEDGEMAVDTPTQAREKLPANATRGTVEDIDDATAQTDQVSGGPLLSRLLAALRPEHRAPTSSEDKPTTNGLTNGDSSANGEVNANADLDLILGNIDPPAPASLPAAATMPESNTEQWKKANHQKLEYQHVEERIKTELRYIGFLPQDAVVEYDDHFDDEIAARLRYLQEQLKEQSMLNGARKARLMELTKERMAHQEYTTILEDLDGQVQHAYLKRTRTMGKSKKAKKPGGAGGGSHAAGNAASGTARPGIGDVTKTLMERRQKWIDSIGTVFEDERALMAVPRAEAEGSSIFKNEDMADLIKREKQAWDEEVDEE